MGSSPLTPPQNRVPVLNGLTGHAQGVKRHDALVPFCGHKIFGQILNSTAKQRTRGAGLGVTGGCSDAG